MNTSKAFKNFWNDLHSKFPEDVTRKFEESDIKQFSETFTDVAMEVLQKNNSIWETPKLLFDVDLSELWKKDESSHELFWKHLQPCGFACILHQLKDIDNKTIGELIKKATGKKDEVDQILEGDNETKFSEFIDFLKNLKCTTYFLNIIDKLDFTELDMDFMNIEDAINNYDKLANSPKFVKAQKYIKQIFEEKVRNGEILKEVIISEIEQVKIKASELFGDMFNDILGGRKSDIRSAEILGNSPEARRARMVARLQRKLKERK
jgi:hypothetical protein